MCNLIDNLILQMFKRDILKSLFLFEIGVFSLPTVTEEQTNEIKVRLSNMSDLSTMANFKLVNLENLQHSREETNQNIWFICKISGKTDLQNPSSKQGQLIFF